MGCGHKRRVDYDCMKLLLDMNIPLKYANLLKEKDFEVLHWTEVGEPKTLDSHIMAYAREHNLIVLTYDLDFSAILSTTRDLKPSVVQIRATLPDAAQVVELTAAAILQNEINLQSGAILTIDFKKSRVRLLPL